MAQRITPGKISVVVGAHRYRCARIVRRHPLPATVVYNQKWRGGMGSSLSLGLRQLLATDFKSVLILLCDQPRIAYPDLRRLAAAWAAAPQRPAAATYAGRLGVPAIIPRRYWHHFMRLDQDRGAGAWLNRNASRITQVKLPQAAFDVDTPEQLTRL